LSDHDDGLFSEEKKRGTIELLLTTPVSNIQAILEST